MYWTFPTYLMFHHFDIVYNFYQKITKYKKSVLKLHPIIADKSESYFQLQWKHLTHQIQLLCHFKRPTYIWKLKWYLPKRQVDRNRNAPFENISYHCALTSPPPTFYHCSCNKNCFRQFRVVVLMCEKLRKINLCVRSLK